MQFKLWLEFSENDDMKNIVFNALGVNDDALDNPVSSWDADDLIKKLNDSGDYVKLPNKDEIENTIHAGQGTLQDLIDLMRGYKPTEFDGDFR